MAIFYVASSADDGCWYSTSGYANNLTNGFFGNWVGASHLFFRFPNITIPQGSTILSAVLRMVASNTLSTSTVNTRISANAEDNPSAPGSWAACDGLDLTEAYVDWTPGSWTASTKYGSPSLVEIIQEIVDRSGWASGNAILLLVKDNGSSSSASRGAYMIESSGGAYKAELEIT
jgi:hypothetical protein